MEKNKRSLRQTLTNNYKAILIAMLLGLITSYLVIADVYEGFSNSLRLWGPFSLICPGIAIIICGLLALIILYISRGSKIGTILGVLIGLISAFFITWLFIGMTAMVVGG